MDFMRLSQIVSRSIGVAIGLGFSTYYLFKALICVTNDVKPVIAIGCIAIVITIVTLVKSKNHIKEEE